MPGRGHYPGVDPKTDTHKHRPHDESLVADFRLCEPTEVLDLFRSDAEFFACFANRSIE